MFFKPSPEARQKKLIQWAKQNKVEITQHPEELALVQKINISGKHLTQLPREIDCLPNLIELDASNNQLPDLSWEFASLKNLKVLNLSHNRFIDLPHVICQLSQLEKLSLEANQIKKISNVIANMVGLIELNLSFNNIIELSNEIGSLRHLTKLNIAANLLAELPKGFAKLFNLVELDLSMNKFDIEPEILKELPNLKVINFSFKLDKINEQLLIASAFDNILLAQKLIGLGADVNYKWLGYGNHVFSTPLFEAHSIEMVKFLLDNKADPHLKREITKTSSIKVWESDKEENETFLTKKHNPELARYLKGLNIQ